jgi:hypothetical protein
MRGIRYSLWALAIGIALTLPAGVKGISNFDQIPMGEKGLQDFYRWIDTFVAEHQTMVHRESLGTSEQGRDIPALFVTNRSIPDQDKQIAVVTLARHGSEVGARVVGPEILNYLVSAQAQKVRDTQLVIVVPVANPDGFAQDSFNSSMYQLTKTERLSLGKLFSQKSSYPPDMIIDYHSLGKVEGSKVDKGDMCAVIPANTTKWGMDEQIHQQVAQKMVQAAEAGGYPYEIHTLEDLALYYFGGDNIGMGHIGEMPWTSLKEKVYILPTLDPNDDSYDRSDEGAYTNYTNAPAYRNWHCLIFGMESNHWGMKDARAIAEAGMLPGRALLEMGSSRFPWEKTPGYPTNLLVGDFRISIRAVGQNASERRATRARIWKERANFSYPQRETPDRGETTIARVRYFGNDLPMRFALNLRLRTAPRSVTLGGKEVKFETYADSCSTFVDIPVAMEKAGTLEFTIR